MLNYLNGLGLRKIMRNKPIKKKGGEIK